MLTNAASTSLDKTTLQTTSPQFARLEYSLQLALGASTARIVDAQVVSNPHLTVQFEKKSKGLLCLDSWLDVASFAAGPHGKMNNAEDELNKRLSAPNFGMSAQGMLFPVGQIRLEDMTDAVKSKDTQSTKRVIKMLLCKVAVGRAFALDNGVPATESLPTGYDSFYLPQEKQDTNEGHSHSHHHHSGTSCAHHHHESAYSHNYWIKNAAQVLPQFLVTFEYDPILEKNSREKPRCDNCESAYASVHCAADNANLCSDCDANLHMANKVAQRHVRTPIGQGADVFGQCRQHLGQKIEFFCSQCHVPVCVHCKMVGHHSSGEAAKHKLVSVNEAFEAVLKESSRKDTVLGNRLAAIARQTEAIEQRSKNVDALEAQLEHELESIYQAALSELHDRIHYKQQVLLGDQLELKRQEQEIQALDRFLEYQRSGTDICHLLFNWSKHQQVRQELHEFQHFKNEIDVQLDLKVDGTVNVVVDELTAKRHGSPPKYKAQSVMAGPRVGTPATVIGGGIGLGMPKNTAKKMNTARRTSDFFAETLTAFDDIQERSSYVNAYDADERSVSVAAGFAGHKVIHDQF